jgi:CheY-like chemotaxis protein
VRKTGFASPAPAERAAPATPSAAVPAQASVLVVSDGETDLQPLTRWLGQHDWLTTLVAGSEERARQLAGEARPEVALIDLLTGGSAGMALAFDLQRAAPHVGVVFFVDDDAAPEAQAARDLGISRVVPLARLPAWLAQSLVPLADIARAQRVLEAARSALGREPPAPGAPPLSLRLPVAERRYREAYLRACMARASGRREAAHLAGVPYSSLCVMLRKLGIGDETGPTPRRRSGGGSLSTRSSARPRPADR